MTKDYIANVTIFAERVNKHNTAMCWRGPLFRNRYVSNHRGLAESSESGKLSKSSVTERREVVQKVTGSTNTRVPRLSNYKYFVCDKLSGKVGKGSQYPAMRVG